MSDPTPTPMSDRWQQRYAQRFPGATPPSPPSPQPKKPGRGARIALWGLGIFVGMAILGSILPSDDGVETFDNLSCTELQSIMNDTEVYDRDKAADYYRAANARDCYWIPSNQF